MQIPNYYEFFSQIKIVSGTASLENIPAEFSCYNAHKPLVVAAKSVTERGLNKKFINAFAESGMTLGGIFDEVRDYASIGLAEDAAFLYKERGCDCIIALGSGPVVDLAKAVNILVSEKTTDLFQFFNGKQIKEHLRPLLCVPTCCFNGMEGSNILTIDNRQIKNDILYPDVIIIDPRMTFSNSRECVAETAAIAISQCLEASVNYEHNPIIDTYVMASLRLLSEHLKKGLKRPKNKKAGLAIANAAVMASIAFSNSKPGLTLLMAEELARDTGVSLGKFSRILLPHVISEAAKKNGLVRDEILLAVGGIDVYASTAENERKAKGLEMVMDLLKNIRRIMPDSIKPMNYQKHKLAVIAKAAAAKSWKRYTAAECLGILERAYEESLNLN